MSSLFQPCSLGAVPVDVSMFAPWHGQPCSAIPSHVSLQTLCARVDTVAVLDRPGELGGRGGDVERVGGKGVSRGVEYVSPPRFAVTPRTVPELAGAPTLR